MPVGRRIYQVLRRVYESRGDVTKLMVAPRLHGAALCATLLLIEILGIGNWRCVHRISPAFGKLTELAYE
jgi:hypothetical protein